MDDFAKSSRSALNRAELPGMSLIEHLEELRKRSTKTRPTPGHGWNPAYSAKVITSLLM
jgi:hypothetical protein